MKNMIRLLLCLLLLCAVFAPALAEGGAGDVLHVTLPDGYEDSGLRYPVLYVMPEDGLGGIDGALRLKLKEAMGESLSMIIVQPEFGEGDDLIAKMKDIIAETESSYRVAPGKAYRTLMGTGAGGYLAYALGLEMQEEIGAMVSIRGNFAENPWLETYGSVQDKLELLNVSDPEYLNGVYTYMDAPVSDIYTNQKGGTNDLGALFVGFGTGSAAHEFTVRPGAYDDAFLTESVARVMDRLTSRMLADTVYGTMTLKKAALSAADETAEALYSVTTGAALAAFTDVAPVMEIVFAVTDPATGKVLDQQVVPGAALEGGCAVANAVNGTSSVVSMSVRMLGVEIPLASATLIRMQEPVIDGDIQKIDLMGDWHFQYTGMQTLDAAALTAETYGQWPVVQPALTSWVKGFGNISDENVTSGYGPDYFNFFITGSGYYAKTFAVPENFDAQELLLSIGYVDDRCEVFLNGVRVGATGMDENGQPTGDTTWAVYSCFDIDPALINRGGENTVIVRAWNDLPFGAGGWYGGPVALYSRAAYEAENGAGDSARFYEESFESEYAAKGLGKSGTVENKYLIYLPESYETSDRYYPTVYLLHQFNSDHTSYRGDKVNQLFDQGAAEGLFDEMIVVIPNSSEESWWTGDWEKMITDELIPLIDGKYRTIRDARYRLTAGCSMGGQGAMAVALRNPDYFTGAVSFFGAFSYGGANSPNAIAAAESAEYMDSFSLYFICGNQDSYGFGVPAIALSQQLEAMNVNHGFFIDNGGHDSAFYIPFFKDAFAYIREDMYKSDAAVESFVLGGLTVSGADVTADFKALEGIEAYAYCAQPSSYTKSDAAQLIIPLTVEIMQDGEVVFAHTEDALVSGAAVQSISLDAAAYVDAAKPFDVTFKAAVFDRVVTLAEIKK